MGVRQKDATDPLFDLEPHVYSSKDQGAMVKGSEKIKHLPRPGGTCHKQPRAAQEAALKNSPTMSHAVGAVFTISQ